MGMYLGLQETDYGNAEDHSWLGSAHGTSSGDSCTLKGSDFVGTFTDGIVPSGVVLEKIVGGPDDGKMTLRNVATTKTQVITRTATGGTVDIIVDGETNDAVAIVAATTAAQVKAALEALSNINDGDIEVTGSAGGPFTVTGDIPDIDIDDTNATGGTVTVAAGVTGVSGGKAVGHLLQMSDVGSGDDVVAAYIWHGQVIVDNLPDDSGWDEGCVTDLPTINYQV